MSLHASHKAKLYNTVYYKITKDYGLAHSIIIKMQFLAYTLEKD